MHILIAEDDPASALALTSLLKTLGHTVTATKDGMEAWDALQKEAFPLAILDWMMPRMDGVEVCKRVRARTGMPYTCVIMLTAKDGRDDRITALNAGADVFLTKPLNVSDLTARLQVAERIVAMERSAPPERGVAYA